MHQEVYIDIVFAANLLMDYILLRLTGIVLRRKNSRRRCLAAAAVGALFACLNLYVRPGKTGLRYAVGGKQNACVRVHEPETV